MVGVRLPVKTIKRIERVAEALSCDRSSAIRWMINDALEQGRTRTLPWSGKGSRFADQIARSVVLGFKAKAANAAVSRAAPADRVEAEKGPSHLHPKVTRSAFGFRSMTLIGYSCTACFVEQGGVVVRHCAGKPLRVKAAAGGGLPMQRIDIACLWHAAPGHHSFLLVFES
jgi:hypothetical protein